MYGIDEDDVTMLWIDRLMIAKSFLGHGYGLAVLRYIISEAPAYGVNRIGLSTEPENLIAKHVFEKAGFHLTGMKDDGEDVYHYIVSSE